MVFEDQWQAAQRLRGLSEGRKSQARGCPDASSHLRRLDYLKHRSIRPYIMQKYCGTQRGWPLHWLLGKHFHGPKLCPCRHKMMVVVSTVTIAFLIVIGMLRIVRFPMRVVFRMFGLMIPTVRMLDDVGKTSTRDREECETNQQQPTACEATPGNTIHPTLRRGTLG